MIVVSSIHPTYLSNSYLVARETGGTAVIIDSGAPIEPLLAAADKHSLTVTHLLNTHDHHDHTTYNVELMERFDIPLLAPGQLTDRQTIMSGDMRVVALSTPGHTETHFAFVIDDHAVFTGDVLFKGSVGGTMGGGSDGYSNLYHSIMDVLMRLPHEMDVYPGHTDATTIGEEWQHNPFIRAWRELDPHLGEPVSVQGRDATLLVWAGDYDGGNKAWVRYADGDEVIVGGSAVLRGAPA
jgi:glyoxylase-like metal-dependent hydrolase (beta-lactamase superfamily II)